MTMSYAYTERVGHWGVEETNLLLKIWGKPWIQREILTTRRNRGIFDQISKEMQHLMPQFSRTGVQCRYRIKRLKREFLRSKEEGCRCPYFDEMDMILTQGAKAAKQVGENSGGKKIRKRKSYSSDDEDFETPTNASEIKIEIDNAEEYEYGVSRGDNEEQDQTIITRSKTKRFNLESREKDSSDDDSEEGSDYIITSPVVSNKNTSKIDEQEYQYVSLPVHFEGKDNEEALASRTFASGDKQDLKNDDGNLLVTVGDTFSIDNCLPCESDSSIAPTLVIKSDYHIKETEQDDATDAEKGDSSSSPFRDKSDPLDEAKVDRESSESEAVSSAFQDRGRHFEAGMRVSSSGEGVLQSTPGQGKSDAVTESHVLDGLPIVANQVTKDLQIIAEWSIGAEEEVVDTETIISIDSDTDSAPDFDFEPGSPALPGPAVTTSSSASMEGGMCEEKSSLQVSSTFSSAVQMPLSPSSVKSRACFKIIQVGGVRTLVKLKEGEPVYICQPNYCKVSTTSSSPSSSLRTLKPKPSVTLLSSSGGNPCLKPGVSLLSSSLKVPNFTYKPKVIRFEKPSTQKEAPSGAAPSLATAPVVRKVVVSQQDGQSEHSDAVSQSLHRHKVVLVSAPTASPSAAAPIRVVKESHCSFTSISNQAGGKVFYGKTSASVTGVSTRQVTSVVHAAPLTTTSASKSLTFTTLSSLNPTPKTMTMTTSPDSTHQSQSSPGPAAPPSKTTIIIPRIFSSMLSPSAAAHPTKVSLSQEAVVKELRKNHESNEEAAEEMSEETPTSSASEKLKGIKRSHEASGNASPAKTVDIPGDSRLQPDISPAQTAEGDSSVVTKEPLPKVLCRYPTASLSATHSAFPGKRKAAEEMSEETPTSSASEKLKGIKRSHGASGNASPAKVVEVPGDSRLQPDISSAQTAEGDSSVVTKEPLPKVCRYPTASLSATHSAFPGKRKAAEEMSEETPTSSASEKLKGIKRSHGASGNASPAKVVEVPGESRLQPDISSAQTAEGDSSVVTKEPSPKVLCRYPTASLSATHSAFPGKRKAAGLPPSSYQLLPTKPVPGLTSEGSAGQLTAARKIFQTVAASSEMVSDTSVTHSLAGKQHQDAITSSLASERSCQHGAIEGKIQVLELEGKQKTSFSKTPQEDSTDRDEEGSHLVARILSQDSLCSVAKISNPAVVTKAPLLNRVTLKDNSRAEISFTSSLINSQVTDTAHSSAQCSFAHALDHASSVLQSVSTQRSSDHPSPWVVNFIGTTDSPPTSDVDTADVTDHSPLQSQDLEQEVIDTTESPALPDDRASDKTGDAKITSEEDTFTASTSVELMNAQQSSEVDLSDPADESDSDSVPNSQPEADSLADHANSHPVGTMSQQPADKEKSSKLEDVVGDLSSLSEEDKDDLFKLFLSQTGLSGQQKEQMMQIFQFGRTDTTQSTGHETEPSSGDAASVEVTNLLSLGVNNDSTTKTDKQTGTFKVKAGLAQMAKGGIIMDVTTPEEARVAEEAGACAVMALERVPADIRRQGGVARMTDPKKIKEIMAAVTIPVMAKCRIGHFAEAQILESLGVDMVDESEVLTPADEEHHVDKHAFKVPFVCGARDLGEALRRISEGAAMIRTKGDAGTGDVVEAVRHARTINRQIRTAQALDHTELYGYAKEMRVTYDLLKKTAELGRLPVVNFAAGGLATPADVSLLMQLGVDGVFVGSGIFKSSDPPSRAHAMAQAVTHYKDPKILASLSENLGEAMFGTPVNQKMRQSAAAPGNKQQEKLWNATLALEKFQMSS